MSGQFPWYVARSAGLVAWALLAASVLWGLALSTKILSPKVRPNWILDLHRWLGGLALIFTGVHVGALLLDTYVHFGLVSVLVPFATSWHPLAVAWGVVSLYLLLAVEVTSLLKSRIPKSVWRKTHFASFALFVTSTVHGVTAGTDTGTTMLRIGVLMTGALFAGLTAARLVEAATPKPSPRPRPGSATIPRPAAPLNRTGSR
ncbi:MAG TPA: ferric reductase-like transmembrane domain-containing protein [Acidimicrobiia bacterium]|nr:ferric reductase-like transmembrane domain-containing protein [Acidimicrobiia bacterium]